VARAEDNPVNQTLVTTLLEKQGHRVAVAVNGREALDALEAQPFDLVLMDVQMPEMDGFTATQAVRRKEAAGGGHVPILAMTAYALQGDRERCLAAGMDGYIAKPVRAVELLAAVEGAVAAGGTAPAAGGPDATPTGPAPAATAIDLSAALGEAGGDQELVRELAGIFLQECPRWLAAIRKAVEGEDPSGLKIAAHTLKGSLNIFAAKAAGETARRLETMGREGNLAGAREVLASLVEELERLRPGLVAVARAAPGNHPPGGS
jgi:CheY-like chemotaxis protein/HPt (histidine-containing phosphotransfer) domain-containing protein